MRALRNMALLLAFIAFGSHSLNTEAVAASPGNDVCYTCDSYIGAMGLHHYCSGNAFYGYEDCFGPMIPTQQCSMYGSYGLCFDESAAELAGEARAELDGAFRISSLSSSERAIVQRVAAAARRHVGEAEGTWVGWSCKGVVVARVFGLERERELSESLRVLSL